MNKMNENKVEERLRKTEEELRKVKEHDQFISDILEYSIQPFGIGYPDGSMGLINRAFEQLTGYSKEELKTADWSLNLTPPEYHKMENDKLEELNRTGKPVKYEKEYIRKNGTRVPIELLVHLVKDTDGNPLYYYSFITDITERKKSEIRNQNLLASEKNLTNKLKQSNQELQSITSQLKIKNQELIHQGDELLKINKDLEVSEEKFLKAFHANPAAMTLSDENGKWIDVNESYANLTGYKKNELIGHTSSELNIVDPDERKRYLDQSKENGSLKDIDFEINTKSGEKRSVISSSEFIKVSDKSRFITFIYDISERKEREKLSNALNKVNNVINSKLDYNEIMQTIMEEGCSAIGAESSVINIRQDGNWIVNFAYNFPSSIIGQKKSDEESPTSVYVTEKKETVAFDNAQTDTRVNKNGMKLHGVTSLMVSPIILKDEVRGIMAFYHHKKSVVFSKAQIDFANKLAFSLSQAIEIAELFEEIEAKERKYHSLYSSMSEGVALHEIVYNSDNEPVDYIINDVNPAYEKILNLKANEVTGMKASEIYGTQEPPYLEIYSYVAENGEPSEFETYFEPMDKYFKISIISPEKGKFATVFDDITSRKLSEQTIQQQADIIELSFDAIIVGQLDGEIESWNRGAKELYGYSEDEAIGKPVYELLNSEFPETWSNINNKLRKYGIWEGEIKHHTKNDKQVIVSSRIQIIMIEEGYIKLLETNRDITKRKHAEEHIIKLLEEEQQLTEELSATNEELQATSEELQSSNEELMRVQNNLSDLVMKLKISNKELEQFAYVASHDLQEPLRMVSSFTQLLERRYHGRLDEDADDYIAFIVEGAKRMKALIDDLLAYSRLNTNIQEFEPVLMEVLLDDVLLNLKASIKENNAQVTFNSLPTISGDRIQINQLMQNLIGNAIKFHGKEDPKIHISAREFGDEWLFSVRDNGIGIDPNHQEQIFSIFKRLHTRNQYEGTGIGLSICKRIVERHGGHIWVESENGKGSIFYFTLPLKP
jgi:PAS domain S-box-containing protein